MENGRFTLLSPLWGADEQRTMFIFRLIGKRVMDFLLVLIELISLGIMAEALRLRTNID